MKILKISHLIALAVAIVGGLNWGAIGIADFNFIKAAFGLRSSASITIYVIFAVASVYAWITGMILLRER